MSADVPETVECPCGNGYAERRKTPIVERPPTTLGSRSILRKTFLYRHDGCPVGGHIVIENGEVSNRAGPLFTANRYPQRQFEQDHPTLVADGGAAE